MKPHDNPMRPDQGPAQRLAKAPRCRAMAKTTRHRCKGPAVTGWQVCRMHGAGRGAPSGPANGRWRHGKRSRSAEALRRALADLVAEARNAALALGA